jgi:two-component system, LytTR family, response regulator
MIRALLVDDEKKARSTIQNMLQLYCSNVELVGEAATITEAAELIARLKPDLVFLDINLPDGTGFDLLQKFNTIHFKVIFITAYEEYAIKAFKFCALDYIVKPIHPDELIEAVGKAEEVLGKEHVAERLQAFIVNMESSTREVKKIVLKTSDSIHVVNMLDIIRCEADRNYTVFFLNDSKKILVSNTLKEYDELLSSYRFFRTHQSHLVNTHYIERYEKKDGGYLVMKDKSMVPVSVRKKEILLDLLDKI